MIGSLRQFAKHTSWPIIAAMLCLILVGIQAIGVSERAEGTPSNKAMKQAIFAGVALGTFVVVTLIPYKRFGQAAYPLFAGTLALLVLVLFLKPIRGSHRWIDLKFVQVQPSELAKLSYIILLAWYLRYGDHYRRLRGLLAPFLLTLIPLGLILKEPDLGTSLLFLPTLYVMLFVAGAKYRHLLGIVAVGTFLVLLPLPQKISPRWDASEIRERRSISYAGINWGGEEYLLVAAPLLKMENHQLSRIVGWLRQDDPRVAMSKGYHLRQSKTVLGSGRWTGNADWDDAHLYFSMLPDDHTDFIFSVIGGRWGFVGCLGVLGLYAVIFIFGIEISAATHDPFGRLLAVGVLALLFSQLCINVGMTMGLMPITGMTLPLISYGGSSLVINCAALGLLVNVGQRRPILLSPKPFEHGQKRQKALAATVASPNARGGQAKASDKPGKNPQLKPGTREAVGNQP